MICSALYFTMCHAAFPSVSECSQNNEDVFFRAEKVSYNMDSQEYRAIGRVEFFYQNKHVQADKVVFSQKDQSAYAEGAVALYDAVSDTYIYADKIQLNQDMSLGFAQTVYGRKNKNLKIAAERIVRKSETITEFHNAVYTPCHLRKDKKALWQLRAGKIIDDSALQDVSYKNVQFEIFSQPIISVPDFTYPRPDVKRRSGWLVPEFDLDTLDGANITMPYFFELSQDKTLTLSPRIYTEHLPLLQADYKQRTNDGYYRVRTAMTVSNSNAATEEFRGSILSNFRTNIDAYSGWGIDFNRATDDTFFQRYDLGQPEYLQSRLFYDYNNGRTSLYAGAYAFQNLDRVIDNDNVPYVLPYIDYKHKSEVKPFGGDLVFSGNIASTYREEGIDTKRLISQVDWTKNYIIPYGMLFTFQNQLRGDLYHTTGGSDPTDNNIHIESGYTARFLPQSSFKFSMPLLKKERDSVQIIEPTVQTIIAPYNNDANRIPNEDGYAAEFDASGLYDLQRFYGYDLVEDGPRANAGIRYFYQLNQKGSFEAQIGQSFRLKDDTRFSDFSGLGKKASDYVGRFVLNYKDNIQMTHRFRLDNSDGALNMSDLAVTAGNKDHKFKVNYFHLKNYNQTSFFNNAEQLNLGWRSSLDKNWHIIGGYSMNLPNSKTLETRGSLVYTDECFIAEFGVGREHIRFRDIEPHTSAHLRIKLLSLGNNGFIQ